MHDLVFVGSFSSFSVVPSSSLSVPPLSSFSDVPSSSFSDAPSSSFSVPPRSSFSCCSWFWLSVVPCSGLFIVPRFLFVGTCFVPLLYFVMIYL